MEDTICMRDFEGQMIADKYRLVRYLNEGAFGAVYEASHVAYELPLRTVAIKVAKRPMDDRQARDIFRDALVMANLVDAAPEASIRQHFVTVHDSGRCPQDGVLAGHPYVAMQMIHGGSIRTCLRPGALPLKRAMTYFDQMLRAVAFMHQGLPQADGSRRPLLHRDIKPDNILVDRGPQTAQDVVKVTDFGLAVSVEELLGWAGSGGDLAYMAPESFSHDRCSPQTDVYMLALVFYEMLTGHSPFLKVGSHLRGTDQEKRDQLRKLHLAARQHEVFPRLMTHPQIRQRPALGEVILAALTLDANSRPYRNAADFLEAWTRAKECGAGPRPETPWETVRRLVGEARQCFAVHDHSGGDRRIDQAMTINRDRAKVPDPMMVGEAYLIKVERLVDVGRPAEALQLAQEGYNRRRCPSTCRALARCSSPGMRKLLEEEASKCEGRE